MDTGCRQTSTGSQLIPRLASRLRTALAQRRERKRTCRCRRRQNNMYGLPPDADFAFFRGRTLLQICVGAHDLILNCDEDISITVISSIAYRDASGAIQKYVDFRSAAPAL